MNILPVDQVEPVLSELETAFYDIPFENSDFQNKNFVIAAQITPARAYRAIGLRMFAKIRAIKEYFYNNELIEIDLEEKEYKMKLESTSSFDKRRLAVEIAKMKDAKSWSDKLLNDALRELNCLYTEFKKYPKYTREQFEEEERLHFFVHLNQQIATSGNGAVDSLANMGGNSLNLEKMLEDPVYLSNLIEESVQNFNEIRALPEQTPHK